MDLADTCSDGGELLLDALPPPPVGVRRVIKRCGEWRAYKRKDIVPTPPRHASTGRPVTGGSTADTPAAGFFATTGTSSGWASDRSLARLPRGHPPRTARDEKEARRLHRQLQRDRVKQVGYDRIQSGRVADFTIMRPPSRRQMELVAQKKHQAQMRYQDILGRGSTGAVSERGDAIVSDMVSEGAAPLTSNDERAAPQGPAPAARAPSLPLLPRGTRRRSIPAEDTSVFEERLSQHAGAARADVSATTVSNLLGGATFTEIRDAWRAVAVECDDDPLGAVDLRRFTLFVERLLGSPPISKEGLRRVFEWLRGLRDPMLKHSGLLYPVLGVRYAASVRGVDFFWHQFEQRGRLHKRILTHESIEAFAAQCVPPHLLDAWAALARQLPRALEHYDEASFPSLQVFAVWVFRCGNLHRYFTSAAPDRRPVAQQGEKRKVSYTDGQPGAA